MKLLIKPKETAKNGGSASKMAIINIFIGGSLRINTFLQRKLRLYLNQTILIAKDGDSRNDWYLSFGTPEQDGYSLHFRNRNKPEAGMGSSYGKETINEILASVNATRSASFYVALGNPKEIDGRRWYRILTANPKIIR